jgi:DNA-binding LacI/PurR family transcriptional regulator
MSRRYITIKDIAKNLNISVATVSRALRDTYDVSQETRNKVLDMALALNYKPNFNATGLVKKSTHNIGIIIPAITNYYFSTVITGIQEIAQAQGYQIILYITNDCPLTETKIINELSLSSLDGLLACVSTSKNAYSHFRKIIDDQFPVVFFDRVPTHMLAPKVMQDDYNGACQAVEHLISNGYKRIAHITGPRELSLTSNRLKGYIDTLKKYHFPILEEFIIHSSFSQKSGELDTYQLLNQGKLPPDAIFCVNDRKGVGAIIALKEMKIEVGKTVGVIGFTNDPISEIISPSLSTIAEPALEIGRQSCNLLLQLIKTHPMKHPEIILSGELIIRESSHRVTPVQEQ